MIQGEGSFETFLNSTARSTVPVLKDNTDNIIEHFQPDTRTQARFAGATFLLDFSTKKYLYVEETSFNVLGYTAQWFLDMGLEEYWKKIHKCDFNIINTKIFSDNLMFLKKLPLTEYNDYIFSYNYRLKTNRGEYITVLQRFSYVPSKVQGIPAGMIGIGFNITHFKTDFSIVHTIEKVINTGYGTVNELIHKRVHPAYEDENLEKILSKRETEILRLVAAGFSSKQIAAKIDLSINTVNNHRKNMLSKLHCTSSSELTNYAIIHGFI